MKVEFALRARAYPGERVSGDRGELILFGDRALVAVADGMGHGALAARAAEEALAAVAANAGHSPERILSECRAGERDGRGATLSVASMDLGARELRWAGVGDVAGALWRRDGLIGLLVPRPGYIGGRGITEAGSMKRWSHPESASAAHGLLPGDLVLLATDGVSPDFASGAKQLFPLRVEEIAEELLARFGKESDDALIAVARFPWSLEADEVGR